MLRPSTRIGSPALGIALIGLVANCIIARRFRASPWGRPSSCRPITSTGQASIARVKVSVSVPPGRWPKSSMVTCARSPSRGPAASRAAKTASRSSSRLPKGLENQQIDAGFEQGIDLLAENGARFGEGGRAQRFDADAQRTDGAGDERRCPWPPRGPAARPPG